MGIKKLFSILLLLCVALSFVAAEKTVIRTKALAVTPFEVIGNAVTTDEAEAITELYRMLLINGPIKIVERGNFDKILTEFNFQASDWSNSEKTAKLGKAINSDFILRGKIMKLGSKFRITITVIDINTAELLISQVFSHDTIDDISTNIQKSAKALIQDLTYCSVFDEGEAGGSVFLIETSTSVFDFYEAVFLTDEKRTFSEAKELASNYDKGGYTDWHLLTKAEAEAIFNNIIKLGRCSDYVVKNRHIFIDDDGDCGHVRFDGSKSPIFYYLNWYESSAAMVCLVRKFTVK